MGNRSLPDKPKLTEECRLTYDSDDLPILHFEDGHEKLDNIDYRILRMADGEHTIKDMVEGLSASFEHEDLESEIRDVLQTINELGLLTDGE